MNRKVNQALNFSDLRELARKKLPRGLFEFVDRGTEDEISLKDNRRAYDSIRLVPRVLRNVSHRTQACEILGKRSTMPIAIAPTGAAGLLWFDGEIAIAKAALQAGIPFTLSTSSIVSMERVASEAGGRLWFQLYMWPDRQMSYRLIERAYSAGYEALIVTVDGSVSTNREYNTRNGFSLPMKVNRKNFIDVMQHPSWFFSVFARYLFRDGIPVLENYPEELRRKLTESQGKSKNIPVPKNDSLTWDDLRDLRKMWKGPLLLKGVLHPDDAKRAVNCGVDGIIVSNHGGRNLDSSVAPIVALPRIAEQVNGRVELFLDSSVTRGSDVVKAIAMGAKAVFIGRAPLWGVSAGGTEGVNVALSIFQEEIGRVMGLAGCSSLDDVAGMVEDGAIHHQPF